MCINKLKVKKYTFLPQLHSHQIKMVLSVLPETHYCRPCWTTIFFWRDSTKKQYELHLNPQIIIMYSEMWLNRLLCFLNRRLEKIFMQKVWRNVVRASHSVAQNWVLLNVANIKRYWEYTKTTNFITEVWAKVHFYKFF